jgi:hypothetical protein
MSRGGFSDRFKRACRLIEADMRAVPDGVVNENRQRATLPPARRTEQ